MSFLRDTVIRYTFRGRRRGFSPRWLPGIDAGHGAGGGQPYYRAVGYEWFRRRIADPNPVPGAPCPVVPIEGSIQSWQPSHEDIEQSWGVQSVAPYMEDTVLSCNPAIVDSSRITGIDLERQRTVSELHQRVIAGDLGQLAARPFTLALGSSWRASWGGPGRQSGGGAADAVGDTPWGLPPYPQIVGGS